MLENAKCTTNTWYKTYARAKSLRVVFLPKTTKQRQVAATGVRYARNAKYTTNAWYKTYARATATCTYSKYNKNRQRLRPWAFFAGETQRICFQHFRYNRLPSPKKISPCVAPLAMRAVGFCFVSVFRTTRGGGQNTSSISLSGQNKRAVLSYLTTEQKKHPGPALQQELSTPGKQLYVYIYIHCIYMLQTEGRHTQPRKFEAGQPP